MNASVLPFSEACERNRTPIVDVLREAFHDCREVLEIGSGTGQHAVHFAAALPQLRWQPSERAEHLASLRRRIELQGSPNLRDPIVLDVDAAPWPDAPADSATPATQPRWDAAFSANTLHIMGIAQVEKFFAGLGVVLAPRARLAVYGPFRYGGRFTSDSNERFDSALSARDAASGIRDVEWVNALAEAEGFRPVADVAMPANNQLLLWQRG